MPSSPFILSGGCESVEKSFRLNERCVLQRVRDRVTDGGVTGAFDYMPSSERREDGRKGERAGVKPTLDVLSCPNKRVQRLRGLKPRSRNL